MVNDEAGQVFQKHIDEGKSKAEATKLKDEFVKERSTELKQAKADRNELKKKQGKDAPAPGVDPPKGTKESPTKIPIQVAGNNSNYFQEVQKAMAVVLNQPAFNKIEKESPLPITGDMAKESGCQARFKDFKFQSHILFCFMHIIRLFQFRFR